MLKRIPWAACLAALLLLLCCAAASAETGGTLGSLSWTLNDDGLLTISGEGAITDFAQFSKSNWRAHKDDIRSVVIQEGVTSIGTHAFRQCKYVTSVSLPDSLDYIREGAFQECDSLAAIAIPAGVTGVHEDAFWGNTMIYAALDTDGAKALGRSGYAFRTPGANYSLKYTYKGTEQPTGLDLASVEKDVTTFSIPAGVTGIGANAFRDCVDLASVTIPEGVTEIGEDAFYDCVSLTSVMIPDSLEKIHTYAFMGCRAVINAHVGTKGAKALGVANLSFRVPGTNYDLRYTYGYTGVRGLSVTRVDEDVTDFEIPGEVSIIGDSAFYGCEDLERVVIPDSVVEIGNFAFSGCTSLTSINIPAGVTSIGEGAFKYCNGLTALTLPTGLTTIEASLLYDCSGLTGIDIPEGVTSIGKEAFYNCSGIAALTLPDSLETIGDYALSGMNSLRSVSLCDNLSSIGYQPWFGPNTTFYANRGTRGAMVLSKKDISFRVPGTNYNIKQLYDGDTQVGVMLAKVDDDAVDFTVPEDITCIGSYAFMDCVRLTSVAIPNGVTIIGDQAFQNCACLSHIVIPDGVTIIGEMAFYDCVSLSRIDLPDSVTDIGRLAFYNCSSLTGIALPEGLTGIAENVFSHCGSLTGITIPATVTEIGNNAFTFCGKLEKVCVMARETTFVGTIFSVRPTIYCYEYSDADLWATGKQYPVVYLDGQSPAALRTVTLPDDFRIAQGRLKYISPGVFPDNDRPAVDWSSSAPGVVRVDGGMLTAVAPGTAEITAVVGGASASVTVVVYVEADDYALSPAEGWVVAKETAQIKAVEIAPAGSELSLTWQSGDEDLATVDAGGLVTTKRPGDVTITAVSAKGVQRSCLLHICQPVAAIALEPGSLTLQAGETAALTASVTTRDGTYLVNKLVTFRSSDETVATVDESGVVTGINGGTATITAAASGVTAECAVTVNGLRVLNLPTGLTTIESEAFANLSSVDAVRISAGVTAIAEDAFAGSGVVIYAPADSYAAEWGRAHGFKVVAE